MLLILVSFMPGMKVYITGEKELIMELSLKWAGNPNITVAAKAFGLKATVQVLDCVKLVSFMQHTHTHVHVQHNTCGQNKEEIVC